MISYRNAYVPGYNISDLKRWVINWRTSNDEKKKKAGNLLAKYIEYYEKGKLTKDRVISIFKELRF